MGCLIFQSLALKQKKKNEGDWNESTLLFSILSCDIDSAITFA